MTMADIAQPSTVSHHQPENSPTSPQPIARVRDLSVEFATQSGWHRVVNGISLDLIPGRILGIVGESGSGKSVTSLAMMRLLPARGARISTGFVEFEGVDMSSMNKQQLAGIRGNRMSMIFQEPMLSLNPAFTVGEQIAETVRRHLGLARKPAWAHAVDMLDQVGIPNARGRANRYPHEFSGGMRQRVMIAIAIACKPRLLIADEPTTALDVTIQAQILELLREMCIAGDLAMMFITHDMGVVADICDDVAVMYAGEIVETGNVRELFASPNHPYSEGLLRSVPTLDNRGQLISIPGSTPAPWELPTGCRFHTRCPYVQEDCLTESPKLMSVEGTYTRCIRRNHIQLGRA